MKKERRLLLLLLPEDKCWQQEHVDWSSSRFTKVGLFQF